ncbi:MAG: FtsX-like permease family protein [Lachnospiraceae bacterium]|nr:FtsX-like permease family protein [Lachnospiraceae bacterium]
MKALIFIAVQNMKKKKGDTLVSFFLIALAAVLLYTSISVFAGLGTVLDASYEKAHTADLLFMSSANEKRIGKIIKSQEEVTEYEANDCLYFMELKYHKEGEIEKKQVQMFLGKIDDERSIGKLTGVNTTDIAYDALLLPYYMKAAEGYAIGDICYLTVGEEEYRFEITGFVEDPLFATPLNISVYGAYISSDCMEDMIKDNSVAAAAQSTQHKVRLKEGKDSFAFDNKLTPVLTQEVPELSKTLNLGVNWGSMKGGVAMMSQISMGILLVFSLLLIVVVLIIIRFSIRNYIEMNLKNVGILQAAGYTSAQLKVSILIEMGIITFAAVITGILLGVAGSGVIGSFEAIMLGLTWKQGFHWQASLVTLVIILGVVLGVAFFSGKIYKKISVLEALRGGICTHNFKKNFFSLEKTKMPLPIVLAMKNLMNETAKNLSVFCIVVILAFAACVGFGLYENFALNTDNLLKMIGAEAGDFFISGENMDEIGQQIEEWEEIEAVLYYANASLRLECKENETAVTCDVWKNPKLVKNEMLIRGRLPEYENEIVLTNNIAKKLGVDVGDTIYVTGQKERMDYLVCGIDQKINNMGLKALLSYKGLKRLNGEDETAILYVYTKDEVLFEDISEKIMRKFPDVSVTNSEKSIETITGGVTLAMVAICLIFVIITIFVVVMVEILLVKSKIIRERRNIGLNKALGFTTRQLMLQTVCMNLPVITVGAICGAALSSYLMEPMVVMCLSFSGIEKCPFTVRIYWMAVTVLGIILVASAASVISSAKIRKIEPVKMLAEE